MNYIFNLVLNGCTNLQWKPLWPLYMFVLKCSHIRFLKPPVTLSHHHPLTIFSLPPQYFVLLLCIFLLEILAGVLAYIYYQQVILLLRTIRLFFKDILQCTLGLFMFGCVHGLILEQLTDIEGYNK